MDRNIIDSLKLLDYSEVIKVQKSLECSMGICCMNIRTSGNIGMIIRAACLMGAEKFIICGRSHYDKRFTVGAHNYISIEKWDSVLDVVINHNSEAVVTYYPENLVKYVLEENWTPVFVEQNGQDIRKVTFPKRPMLIMGNESSGIPEWVINKVKELLPETITVSIPQYSVLRSMNVAMAANIVMYEIRNKMENK